MRMRTPILALLLAAILAGCGNTPHPAEIEAVSMAAAQQGDEAAETRLAVWAKDGLPVAQRELGLLYRMRGRQDQARVLFEQAARKADPEASYQMGELDRGHGRAAEAARWYGQAAGQGHGKAALALALMLKNGDGVVRDKAQAAQWLEVAAAAGDAHAMFLLSNAYADGDGVKADPRRARALLERAADHEYPAALQQLALVKQTGDALTARDGAEAAQLLKEATEHRRSNARRF